MASENNPHLNPSESYIEVCLEAMERDSWESILPPLVTRLGELNLTAGNHYRRVNDGGSLAVMLSVDFPTRSSEYDPSKSLREVIISRDKEVIHYAVDTMGGGLLRYARVLEAKGSTGHFLLNAQTPPYIYPARADFSDIAYGCGANYRSWFANRVAHMDLLDTSENVDLFFDETEAFLPQAGRFDMQPSVSRVFY